MIKCHHFKELRVSLGDPDSEDPLLLEALACRYGSKSVLSTNFFLPVLFGTPQT